MSVDAPRAFDREQFVQPQSIFEVVDSRVDPSVLIVLRLAEKAGILERLPQRDTEMLVEYITAPITAMQVGSYYGLRKAAAQQRIRRSFQSICGYLRHVPSLIPADFVWKPIGSIKTNEKKAVSQRSTTY